jgi:hypothetical protein
MRMAPAPRWYGKLVRGIRDSAADSADAVCEFQVPRCAMGILGKHVLRGSINPRCRSEEQLTLTRRLQAPADGKLETRPVEYGSGGAKKEPFGSVQNGTRKT